MQIKQSGRVEVQNCVRDILSFLISDRETKQDTVTILAFIFIPFSLATSIFGMNIQELNQSGKSIKTFFLTAFMLLAGAILGWTFVAVVNRAHDNLGQRDTILKTRYPYIQGKLNRVRLFAWQNPRLGIKFLREGLLLCLLTGGLYDIRGMVFLYDFIREEDEAVRAQLQFPVWPSGRHFREWRHFLGLQRLPEEEDFNQVWAVRNFSKYGNF